MKVSSVVNAQTTSEESVTCIAVKEDKHQNIMSSVALNKGVEEPWTIERLVNFIDLLGYHEIRLKSDTEAAIIAFRNRAVEMCEAKVATEDAVKRDKPSHGLIENAMMLEFGATVGCPSCTAIIDNKRAQARSDRRRVRSEECLRITPQGAERLDRRSEVIKEALAEEIQRGEQGKKRSDNTTATTPEPAGPAAQNLRESPIEPDPNHPK